MYIQFKYQVETITGRSQQAFISLPTSKNQPGDPGNFNLCHQAWNLKY